MKNNFIRSWLIGILAVVIICTAVLLIFQIISYGHSGIHTRFTKGRFHATSVEQIQPWMTFAYLNRVFSLPADYLKTKLSITGTAYPRQTLSGFAKTSHQDTAVVIKQVQQAITDSKLSK